MLGYGVAAETRFYQQCGEKGGNHTSQPYGSEGNLIHMKTLASKIAHNLLN